MTDAPTFDLQSHSLHSDGALEPADVVRAASAAGVQRLALTDHDTIDGVAEAAATAEETGIVLIPAVEISAVDECERDFHILGYLIDPRGPELLARLEGYRADRLRRSQAMTDALRELGFAVEEAPLQARSQAGEPVGRPHIAQAIVSHPANSARLHAEGLSDATDVLVAYLIEGAPAYRPRRHPSVAEAIEAIHAAGGVAVWAHPFFDLGSDAEVMRTLDRFRSWGIDGVECFYPTHTAEQVALLAPHCQREGLLSTGSADFHGPEHPKFSRFRAFSTYGFEPRLGPVGE